MGLRLPAPPSSAPLSFHARCSLQGRPPPSPGPWFPLPSPSAPASARITVSPSPPSVSLGCGRQPGPRLPRELCWSPVSGSTDRGASLPPRPAEEETEAAPACAGTGLRMSTPTPAVRPDLVLRRGSTESA
ncbi:vegetative cell wall protein gp1-like [Hyaena hyaena]|uniref:vegetative cell wall protein gp1-like n=1 Tax=Hyaena hyaena TaxID=95912 RepID=UPI001923FB69|nr:vegetative cell wall protein gp1-like [Hyaena hyaena]